LTNGNPGLLWTVLSFLLVVAPLIFVHELGHYLVGRWFGVKAETFSIGFGREVFGWSDRRGTRWKLAWLPLGGYVRFAGDMNPASIPTAEWLALPPEERVRTFQAKPVWQRFLIVAAGPATNFLVAILLMTGFVTAYGHGVTPAVVGAVEPRSAAMEAGLQAGDRIAAIDGEHVDDFEDIRSTLMLRPAQAVRVDFVRAGAPMSVIAHLKMEVERDSFGNEAHRPMLGIAPGRMEIVRVSPLRAGWLAVRQTGQVVALTTRALGQIIVGERSVHELGGPLRTAKLSGEQTSLGLVAYLGWITFVSINLGFINLLPIPMLDGGHLLFYAIEAVRRRPLKPEAQEWAFRTGLAALLALMLFVTFNDLASFGLWAKLGGLIG
jgi:regulator of sigma E protease